MRQEAALFGPIVEVRDVLESFLRSQVLVRGWREKLVEASQQFIELGEHPSNGDLTELGQRIAVLAHANMDQEPTLTRELAADVESLIDQIHVPDVPRPEDNDWSF